MSAQIARLSRHSIPRTFWHNRDSGPLCSARSRSSGHATDPVTALSYVTFTYRQPLPDCEDCKYQDGPTSSYNDYDPISVYMTHTSGLQTILCDTHGSAACLDPQMVAHTIHGTLLPHELFTYAPLCRGCDQAWYTQCKDDTTVGVLGTVSAGTTWPFIAVSWYCETGACQAALEAETTRIQASGVEVVPMGHIDDPLTAGDFQSIDP